MTLFSTSQMNLLPIYFVWSHKYDAHMYDLYLYDLYTKADNRLNKVEQRLEKYGQGSLEVEQRLKKYEQCSLNEQRLRNADQC